MIDLDIQNPNKYTTLPSKQDMQCWVEASLQKEPQSSREASIVIRFVDEQEGLALNADYRQKDKATNVLSFPFEMPDFMFDLADIEAACHHLGDLVLCEPIVRAEALAQQKTLQQHWAHLIVHGALHLQGYDHINDDDANHMESLEINILEQLGFTNPYKEQ